MPQKKRRRIDDEGIATEPDHRRATGNSDDDDFEEEYPTTTTTEHSFVRPGTYVHLGVNRYLRKSHKPAEFSGTPFPFLLLPAEIRYILLLN